MYVDEALVLEKAVDGVGRYAAHPEGGGEQVAPGPQVGDGAQVLHAVTLLLQGILRGGGALHLNPLCLDLQGLLGLGGEDQLPGDDEGRAHILSGDLLIIAQGIGVHDHLQVPEAGAVVELRKSEGFHVTDGTGPAADGDGLAVQLRAVGVDRRDLHFFHIASPSFHKIGAKIQMGCIIPLPYCFYKDFSRIPLRFPRSFSPKNAKNHPISPGEPPMKPP